MVAHRVSLVIVCAVAFSQEPANQRSTTRVQSRAPERGKTLAPPRTWREHWFEHRQLLRLFASNDDVVIYCDDAMPRKGTEWISPFLTKVWRYTKKTYGNMGPDPRLFAVLHQGRYFGGHPSTYFDASHDHRNVIDCGTNSWGNSMIDTLSHEVGNIVESASNGVSDSPAYDLWKDSKWIEFYQYDLYVGLGMDREARRLFDKFSRKPADFPARGTHWFRDFFYPLWRDHAHAQVMVRFFQLLATYYPKELEEDGRTSRYSGRMNWGEFIHFMSGAAGKDLRPLAKQAFGWPEEWDEEYRRARSEFPEITYEP
jgi:hypothetical protein